METRAEETQMNHTYTRSKAKMFDKFDFDDSTAVEFFEEKNNIILKLEDVTDRNQMLFNGTVTFIAIKSAIISPGTINAKVPESIGVVYNYGSISHFEQQKEDMYFLMVDWHGRGAKEHERIIYEISCESIKWEHEETGLHISSLSNKNN